MESVVAELKELKRSNTVEHNFYEDLKGFGALIHGMQQQCASRDAVLTAVLMKLDNAHQQRDDIVAIHKQRFICAIELLRNSIEAAILRSDDNCIAQIKKADEDSNKTMDELEEDSKELQRRRLRIVEMQGLIQAIKHRKMHQTNTISNLVADELRYCDEDKKRLERRKTESINKYSETINSALTVNQAEREGCAARVIDLEKLANLAGSADLLKLVTMLKDLLDKKAWIQKIEEQSR